MKSNNNRTLTDKDFLELRLKNSEFKKDLDLRIKKMVKYITDILEKQGRILRFSDIYGDGSLYYPFSKKGAAMVYRSVLEVLQTIEQDNCSWCNGGIMDIGYGEKCECHHCKIEIDDFINS